MRQALLVLFSIWMSGCNEDEPFPPFMVSNVPPDAGPPLVAPKPTGEVAQADLAVSPDLAVSDGGVQDASISGASVPNDMAQTQQMATHPDLAHNPAGPWPVTEMITYRIGDVIDSSPDEGQNIWAATEEALFLLRPGSDTFEKFTAADGLHVQSFTDPYGNPQVSRITALAGGAANQVFVGYFGYEDDDRYHDTLAQRSLGQADKVTLGSDGKITALHYLFRCDGDQGTGNGCWENRSARRMVYAHTGAAAGHLFIGFDHGVSHIFNDTFGDHIHVEVWYHYPDGHVTEKIGEQYGLYVMPNGDLWTASGYGVGVQAWNADPRAWVRGRFKDAFTVYTGNHELDTPADYREDQRGVGVTSDGHVWFASKTHGLWSYDGTPHNYTGVKQWTAPSDLMDLAVDVDDTLWLVTSGGQLLRFDPKTNGYSVFPGLNGARRVVLDQSVTPRALYVSTSSGLVVIRAK